MGSSGELESNALSAAVASVIITGELGRRTTRSPDYGSENTVLLKLVGTMAKEPHRVLQELVDSVHDLCHAGSAGLSLLEPGSAGADGEFRWVATSGGFSHLVGTTMPRSFSPCGTALDLNQLVLMAEPTRAFPYISTLPHPAYELMLVPFHCGSEPIGTIWLVAHDEGKHFDQEDARLVTRLSQVAAAAIQVIETAQAKQKMEGDAREHAEHEVKRLDHENQRFAALMQERDRVEDAVRRELQDTRRLREVAARMIGPDDGSSLFHEILNAAIDITGADAGTIQLLDPASQSLGFLATHGFDKDILAHFARVEASSGSPCGVALSSGQRAFMLFDDPGAPDPDGALQWHLDSGIHCAQSTPLLSRSGRPLGMFSTHWRERRELTERELRFLDLLGRQAADLIERNQAERALQDREWELREGARRKDEFLAVLAHELRNPLAPIRNGVELIRRAREQPALLEQIGPVMERQVRHMVRLVDDLLDVSRINSGKVVLRRESISLWNLIGSAVEANNGAIAAAGLDLQVELDEPDRRLYVDPTRISQVISNVLHNATKFTPAGGKIKIRSELRVSADLSPPEVVLRIADTGAGIPQALLTEIFELFTQARTEGSQRSGGLGIGLALARGLVEMHGGTISAFSDGPGRGSEFIIRIPALVAPEEALPATADPGDMSGVRVLVVDDNQDGADSIALLMSGSGGEVRVTYDALSALDILRGFDPALVLLDIGMPGMDGYEACRRIRQEKGDSVFIAALTGWGQEEDRRRTTEAGFDAHLTKPIGFDQLISIVALVKARAAAEASNLT